MNPAVWLLGLSLIGRTPPESVADVVTLRDRSVVLGALVESQPKGPVLMVVRRGWVEAKLPGRAKAWEAEADRQVEPALAEKMTRLLAWKRDRKIPPISANGGIDPVANWIETELAKAADRKSSSEWPLMMVRLDRAEVESIAQKPSTMTRLLRFGWRSGFPDVETMEPDVLKQALEDRGFETGSDRPVDLESILEPYPEPESRWFEQRAATELTLYNRPRILRYRNCLSFSILSDRGVSPSLVSHAEMVREREIRGQPLVDTVQSRLEHLAGTGQFGALELRLELAHDLTAVKVESTILARTNDDRWTEVVHRADVIRIADLPNEASGPSDPPSKADLDLRVFEAIAFGAMPPEGQRHRPKLEEAARKALSQAYLALGHEIAARALPDRSH